MKKSLLVEGRIPVHTECPFESRCEIKRGGECKHLTAEHVAPFSCATARGFDLIHRDSKS